MSASPGIFERVCMEHNPLDLTNVAISQALGVLISFFVSQLKRLPLVATYPKVVAAVLSLAGALTLHYVGGQGGGAIALVIFFCQQLATAIGGYEVAKTLKSSSDDSQGFTRRFPVIFLVFGLVMSQSACNKDQLLRAANASAVTASLINLGIDTKLALAQDGTLDRDGELAVTLAMFDLNRAVKEFNTRARTYTEFTSETRAELLILLNDVTAGVSRLNDQGVLRIQNPQAKARFQKILTRVRTATALASIWASLKKVELKDRDPQAMIEAAQLFEQASATLDRNAAKLAEDLARLQPKEGGEQ